MPQTHTHSDAPVLIQDQDAGSNVGLIVGIILAIAIGLFLLFYGIPFLSSSARQSTPDVSVPDRIDVNLNQ